MRVAAAAIAMGAAFAAAQTNWSETKVLAPDGLPNDNFGQSVALGLDRILVGARGFDSAAGAAYVFTRDGSAFAAEVKWTKAGGRPAEQFGSSVALDGTTALVGCRMDGELGALAGAAYVYVLEAGTWRLQQKLIPSDGGPLWQFGRSVAIEGDLALVGAFGEANYTGSAYVFRRSGGVWRQEAKLVAPDRGGLDYFGSCVSLDAGRAAVGAYGYRLSNGGVGAAFLYEAFAGAWWLSEALTAPDGEPEDGFGISVALSGDRFLAGAINDDDQGANAGAGYVFRRDGSGWTFEQKLTADDGGDFDFLGWTAALDGRALVLGATGDEGNRGSAYVFRLSCGEWRPIAKLVPTGGGPGIYFTRSLDILGLDVLVGAHHDSTAGSEAGAAYFFEASNPPQDCPASAFSVDRGRLLQGDLESVHEDDGIEVVVQQRFPFGAADPNARIVFEGAASVRSPAKLVFKARVRCTALPIGSARVALELYDFSSSRWVPLLEAPATRSETYVECTAQDAARYVEASSGRIAARIAWRGGDVIDPAWTVGVDQVAWTLEP